MEISCQIWNVRFMKSFLTFHILFLVREYSAQGLQRLGLFMSYIPFYNLIFAWVIYSHGSKNICENIL